jgi:hypothetical protein
MPKCVEVAAPKHPERWLSQRSLQMSHRAYGSLIAVDQDAWHLEGIRMCTSHSLDERTGNSAFLSDKLPWTIKMLVLPAEPKG